MKNILSFTVLSYCFFLLAAAQSLEFEAENPKLNDPFLAELFSISDYKECPEPEADGLMFSCEHQLPPVVFVEAGSSLQLNCSVSGKRNMIVQWKKGGHTLATGPARPRRGAKTPILRTEMLQHRLGCVTPEDAGVYSCVAFADGLIIRQETQVYVMDEEIDCPPATAKTAPHIYAYSDTLMAEPGFTARLTCRAAGIPEPSIEWYQRQPDMSFRKVENKQDGHTLYANGDIGLPPLSLEPIHFSEYKCVAKNELGEDTAAPYVHAMPTEAEREIEIMSEGQKVIAEVPEEPLFGAKRGKGRVFWQSLEDFGSPDTHEITELDLLDKADDHSSKSSTLSVDELAALLKRI